MSFTREAWQEIDSIYAAVLAHPFIRGMAAGTLGRESFVFYMKQDALYLRDFSRALAIAAVRAPEASELQAFLEFAAGVAVVERGLHETYLREFEVALDVEKAPACFAYTHFLLSTAALTSYPEAIGALLPCFWIYREAGLWIHASARPSLATNPYARWIETYAGEQFSASVDRALAIADRIAGAASASDREAMKRAFVTSSRLEWMFWDSAYRLEAWPLAG
jgi:thiaminase/transcriptional activator TenA